MQMIDLQTPIRPDALASDRAQQSGLVKLDQLPRFAEVVESSEPLNVNLSYGRDHDGVYIDSKLRGSCQLLCQFCLSSYAFPLDSHTRFRPVLTIEATREINPDDEPVLYEDGFVNLISMIEDDALLAIPNYPKCKDCISGHDGYILATLNSVLENDQER